MTRKRYIINYCELAFFLFFLAIYTKMQKKGKQSKPKLFIHCIKTIIKTEFLLAKRSHQNNLEVQIPVECRATAESKSQNISCCYLQVLLNQMIFN